MAEEETETLYVQYSGVTTFSPRDWEVVGRHQPLTCAVPWRKVYSCESYSVLK